MKKLKVQLLALALFLQTCTSLVFAQSNYRWEVGLGGGVVGYLGDLNKRDLVSKEMRPTLSVFVRKYLNDFFALRYNFQAGQLYGRDSHYADRLSRNLTLECGFIENSMLLEWDFYNINPVFYRQRYGFQTIFSPYFYTGISLIHNSPKPNYDETNTPYTWIREGIEKDRNAPYPRTHLAIPVGLGIKYDLSPKWVLALEMSFRFATTDYLDGVSYAGNPNRKDAYQMATFNITHRLGLEKMKIRRKW